MNPLNEIKIEKQKRIALEKQTLYEAEFLKLNEQEKNSFLFYKEKFPNVRERTLFKRFKNNFWIIHTMSENLLDTHKCHTDWFKRAYTALNVLGETKVMQKIEINENIYKIICDEFDRRKKELQELSGGHASPGTADGLDRRQRVGEEQRHRGDAAPDVARKNVAASRRSPLRHS